ncbi:hypothetical protein L0V05_13820 [Tabrizicola sp. J26]|uniref:Leu/Phe/Val dehydrogenase n=1 Tax=Alitabrizicola rongguiensis TaxID=2909234 RepID=UPI001F2B1A75|nr:Glu/Leu/Phe/Val dehydrogenase dimerization domain-containing protein [Tabrizicola rongguiensis]MCF1709893.1 hypothetical protein [Tabrizicola rongguiensis]
MTFASPVVLNAVSLKRLSIQGYEEVVEVRHDGAGLHAFIAIHDRTLGPAFGGCRMMPYQTTPAALSDALLLSAAMTRKSALADLPFGGGKCVVIGEPARQKSDALLLRLAEAIDRLGGRYLTADDVGTSVRDMEVMRRVTPHARGLPDAAGEPCPAAAYGTFLSLLAAARLRFGVTDLSGVTVAVQGLGSLGFRLCRYLRDAGAQLLVSDIRPEAVEMARAAFDAVSVPPDRILSAAADILSPNALGGVLTSRSIADVKAPLIVGGANNQLQEKRLAQALHERAVLFVPDYVANAGGVIDVALEGPGYSAERVLKACGRIADTTLLILARASRKGRPPLEVAEALVRERLVQGAARQDRSTIGEEHAAWH